MAHDVERPIARELVRLQGFVRGGAAQPVPQPTAPSAAAPAEGTAHETTLVIHGSEKRFALADYQVFGTLKLAEGDTTAAPPRIVLQGDRAPLVKIAEAPPEQRVTILAERRPGGSEMFLLTLDLCPP